MVVLAFVGHTPDMSTLWSSMNIVQQHLSNKSLFRELSERVIIVIVTVMIRTMDTLEWKPSTQPQWYSCNMPQSFPKHPP